MSRINLPETVVRAMEIAAADHGLTEEEKSFALVILGRIEEFVAEQRKRVEGMARLALSEKEGQKIAQAIVDREVRENANEIRAGFFEGASDYPRAQNIVTAVRSLRFVAITRLLNVLLA